MSCKYMLTMNAVLLSVFIRVFKGMLNPKAV
nr:MAG TPA: hypothetical protein [Caudoviricetes sp.]